MKKLILWIIFLAFFIVSCGKSEKEECEKDSNKQWDSTEKKCVNKGVSSNNTNNGVNNNNSSTTVAPQTTDPEYTITNLLADEVSVTTDTFYIELASATLVSADEDASKFIYVPESTGAGCVIVKKSQFTKMKITKKSTSEIVCDNNNNVFDDCAVSHLKLKEVPALPSGTVGRAVQSLANENCSKILVNQ